MALDRAEVSCRNNERISFNPAFWQKITIFYWEVRPVKKLILACIAVTAVAGILLVSAHRSEADVKFDTTNQTVLLDNGSVYFSKLQGAGTDYPVLTDVYYVQSQVNHETKEVKNILIRQGSEWHSPDRTVLNARHIVVMEPVGLNSTVHYAGQGQVIPVVSRRAPRVPLSPSRMGAAYHLAGRLASAAVRWPEGRERI